MAGLFFCERLGENVWRELAESKRMSRRMVQKRDPRRAEQHRINLVEIVLVALENLAERTTMVV
jgi:hypothetical protein